MTNTKHGQPQVEINEQSRHSPDAMEDSGRTLASDAANFGGRSCRDVFNSADGLSIGYFGDSRRECLTKATRAPFTIEKV